MKGINLHIYPTIGFSQSRILRETKSIIDYNVVDQIVIAAIWEKGILKNEVIDTQRTIKRFELFMGRFRKNSLTQTLKYIEFILKVFWFYRTQKLTYLNCHSLWMLPIGVLLKKYGKAKLLIYDTHELETERVGLKGTQQRIARWLEKNLISHVDRTVVVCQPIADWYRRVYGLKNIYVIQNMPNRTTTPPKKHSILKEKHAIPKEEILFIYQGILEEYRGIITLLNTFANTAPNKHIVFMGYGSLEGHIKRMTKQYSNIHFQPAVIPSEIIEYTSGADIGVFFIESDLCLSYQYSLPNKFGEYILAGLPVLVSSSLSYLTEIVNDNKCGWSLNTDDNTALSNFVSSINKDSIELIKINVNRYANTIGWELEEQKLSHIYTV